MAQDYTFTFLILGIVVSIAAFVGTNIWNNRIRKDRLIDAKRLAQTDIEKTATEKSKDERTLAKEIAVHNKELALEVKQDMKDHVDRLVVTLKSDIELQRTMTYAKMDGIETKVAQIKIDLLEHIQNEKDERIRMQRAIDFFQTMQFGPEAKSIPAYVTGEEEKAGHEEEPYKGVFASRADTTHKDTKDPIVQSDPPKESKTEQDKDAETESESK